MDVASKPSRLADKLEGVHVGARSDLDISRHVFFGEISYVVRDPVTFEGHNLSPSDYEILSSLRDDRSLADIFASLVERRVVEPDQEEGFYRFVVELQKRSLLSLPVTDGESLYQQFEQRQTAKSQNLLMRLLFLRIPLGCPDQFLRSTYPTFQGLFSKPVFVVWWIGLLSACLLVATDWTEFTSDLASVLAIQNLPAILVVMSLLKLWHELGHGYACRHFGVSVPSAGLMFMMGTPLAFMDATGSWSLSRRWQRQVINLAGIYFEMMIAIIAAYVWVFVDQPTINSLAHFTLLIASVTTIAFNVNPLMKYDGYYVLSDALGIPNLKARSAFAAQSLARKLFFGFPMRGADSFALQAILVTYGIASSLYRVMLVVGISMMIALKIWIAGVGLAVYYMATSLGAMLLKVIKYLWDADEIRHRRELANVYLAILLIAAPILVFSCPIPGRAQARGVAEPESLHVVHVKEGGVLKSLGAKPGDLVSPDTSVARVENVEKWGDHSRLSAELISLATQYRGQQGHDRIGSSKTEQEIENVRFELSLATNKQPISDVLAGSAGRVVSSLGSRDLGRYLRPGEELMRLGGNAWIVRAVANASSVADIDPYVGQIVHFRFLANPGNVFEGKLKPISVSGTRVVPHVALTHLAGGFIPVNPDTMEAMEPFFELLIEFDDPAACKFLKSGHVCEIRFGRSYQTLGEIAYRAILRFTNKISVSQS